MTGNATIEITIRLAEAPEDGLDRFVATLETLGLREIERRDRFLMIIGRGPAGLIDEIKRLPGVASARESKTFGPS